MTGAEAASVQRDLGRMEAQIDALTKQVGALSEQVERLTAILNEARGGWKILVLVGGLSAAFGGFVVKLLPFLRG